MNDTLKPEIKYYWKFLIQYIITVSLHLIDFFPVPLLLYVRQLVNLCNCYCCC